MLADDKLVSQEIAVLRLIDISKKNKIYDDTIKLAFIKRMKAPYKEVDEALAKTKNTRNRGIQTKNNIKKNRIPHLRSVYFPVAWKKIYTR